MTAVRSYAFAAFKPSFCETSYVHSRIMYYTLPHLFVFWATCCLSKQIFSAPTKIFVQCVVTGILLGNKTPHLVFHPPVDSSCTIKKKSRKINNFWRAFLVNELVLTTMKLRTFQFCLIWSPTAASQEDVVVNQMLIWVDTEAQQAMVTSMLLQHCKCSVVWDECYIYKD